MSKNKSATGFVCLNCSGTLIWMNDFDLAELTENPDDKGIVTFFSCRDCGAQVESIYNEANDERLNEDA